MNRKLYLILNALLLGVFASCSDKSDGPDNKGEPYYKLYFASANPKYTVLVFNTKTGEVIDSIYYAANFLDALEFTSDGRYACYGKDRRAQTVWVTNNPQGDTIAIRNLAAGQMQVSKDDKYLLFSGRNGLWVLSLPDLSDVAVDPRVNQATLARFDPQKKRVYYRIDPIDSLFVMNFENSPATIQSVSTKTLSGSDFLPGPMEVSPDGRLLFIRGDMLHPLMQILDTDSFHVFKEVRLDTDSGWIATASPTWYPGGRRLFFASSKSFISPPVNVVGIYTYDLQTHTLSPFISRSDLNPDSLYFNPVDLAFTPDGKKLFVASMEGANVAQFDVETRSFDRTLFSGNGYYTAFTLDPTPYYK